MPSPDRQLNAAAEAPGPWRVWLDVPPDWTADAAGVERALERLADWPGVAAARGELGGLALEIALAADLIVVDPGTRLRGPGSPHRLAGTPGRLADRLGWGQAVGFWLDGRGWSARRAATRGLVDAVSGDPVGYAERCLERWSAAGPALPALRRLLRAGGRLDESAALALERAEFALLFSHEDPKAAARAFLARRRR
ncbi:MAG: enoyl-CoA hydratase/isomerase family protein [Acidobacteria bacterium]|nr:MAG: enoyl-CoA hydratase/isomerase family protein [Acidobacteriota bacterium]